MIKGHLCHGESDKLSVIPGVEVISFRRISTQYEGKAREPQLLRVLISTRSNNVESRKKYSHRKKSLTKCDQAVVSRTFMA